MKKYFLLFFLLILFPFFCFSLELRYPGFGGVTITDTSTPADYALYIYNFAVATVGIFALASLILAGFQYFTSVGIPEIQRKAKSRIKAAFLGILLLAFAHIILTVFRREWGQLTQVDVPPVGQPATQTPSPPYSYDPLIHIHNTAKTMRDIISEIRNGTGNLRDWLQNCSCDNLENSCALTFSGCGNVGCLGDPCADRPMIDQYQILLRLWLEDFLFNYRLLVDASSENNLTPELWGPIEYKQRDSIIRRLDDLRRLVNNLEDPINQLRPLVIDYTTFPFLCQIDNNCTGTCTKILTGCLPQSQNCTAIDPNQHLCPIDLINNTQQNIGNRIDEILNILNQIINFALILPAT